MSRISSTFGKQTGVRSSQKFLGASYSTEVPNMSSSSLKISDGAKELRRSTGNLSGKLNPGKLNKSKDMANIEAEYIKNLQQQIYFLELESNYLREQTRKATDIQPKMTAEAERMLSKIRRLQLDMDSMELEMNRKDSNVVLINSEKDRILERLRDEEDAHGKDKRLLMDELVQLKKEKVAMETNMGRRDTDILNLKTDLERNATALKTADIRIQTFQTQLEERVEQHKMTQVALEGKRTEHLSTETRLKELEDKYYNSPAKVQVKVVDDMRDEIRVLRQRLKESEMSAEQDRYLNSKINSDTSDLVKENAMLNQQLIETEKQLEREQSLREDNEQRRTHDISEYVSMKDNEQQMRLELDQVNELLRMEKEKSKRFLDQYAQREKLSTAQELELSTTKSRLSEIEGHYLTLDADNAQLRRDKIILVEHIADIQKKLDSRDQEVRDMYKDLYSVDSRIKELEQVKTLEENLQTQKWAEFNKLANSMRSLSHSMVGRSGVASLSEAAGRSGHIKLS